MPRSSYPERVQSVGYSPDQKYLFVVADSIEVHDVATGKLMPSTTGDAVDEYLGVRSGPDDVWDLDAAGVKKAKKKRDV